MSDPPRSDTAATIRDAQDLGIKIKMLTGDGWSSLGSCYLSLEHPVLTLECSGQHRSGTCSAIGSWYSVGFCPLFSFRALIAQESKHAFSLRIFDSEKLISGSGMTGAEVRDFVEAADGFGEVFPEHKNVELSSSFW